MKLSTLKNDTRDGCLIVVSSDLRRCIAVPDIAVTLQAALDDWDHCAPRLAQVHAALNADDLVGSRVFDPALCHSPLPRVKRHQELTPWRHVKLTPSKVE
ncbi:hypothetical protein CCAE64S_01910 [Castellaniella caeni]